MKKFLSVLLAFALVFGTLQIIIVTSVTPLAAAATSTPTPTFAPSPTIGPLETPELPRIFLDSTYSAPTGNTITVNQGGNLQTAINSANLGDTIVLQAGATFNGSYSLPNKAGDGWIYIRSSAYSSLPVPNNRVSPSDAVNMPKIQSTSGQPTFTFQLGAHHYRFIGLDITSAYSGLQYNLITAYTSANISETPHDIVIDRCYVHGTDTSQTVRGMFLDCARTAIVDSYFSTIHNTIVEGQALCGMNGPGPFKIVNNYLEAGGENVMFGGGDSLSEASMPQDIEFRCNLVSKPLSWYVNNPSYAGTKWFVKNIFELKNAKRVLVDGNIFENNWGMGQQGNAILFTTRNQDGTNPWAVVRDVTFTHNIIRHVAAAFTLQPSDNGHPSDLGKNILIRDNLIVDQDPIKYGYWYPSQNAIVQIGNLPNEPEKNFIFDHNTIVDFDRNAFEAGGCQVCFNDFQYTNNLNACDPPSSWGDGNNGPGTANQFLSMNTSGTIIWNKNVFPGGSSTNYPSGTYFGAVNYVNESGGDYHLAASSPYKNAGTDGKDLGADIDAINTAINDVDNSESGFPTPLPSTPTPSPTPSVTPVGQFAAVLQQGLNGYTGAKDQDEMVQGSNSGRGAGTRLMLSNHYGLNGVMYFDLSGIPSNATIDTATLTLNYNACDSFSRINLFRITDTDNIGMWNESTAVDWNTSEGVSTMRRNGTGGSNISAKWTNANGSTILDSVVAQETGSIAFSKKDFTDESDDVTTTSSELKNDVQAWVNGTAPNQGWYLNSAGSNMTVGWCDNLSGIASKENAAITKRPKLTIIYHVPSAQTPTPVPTPTLAPTPVPTPTPLLGDVTGDGKVMPGDALKLLQYISGKITLTPTQMISADVTKNGIVQPSDALKILQYCAGKIPGL